MSDQPPVLIVDVGGTLLTRSRPGLAGRVVRAVRHVCGAERPEHREQEIRTAVLTAADPDDCLRSLVLPDSAARAAVLAELTADAGEAVVLPGAEELLRTATELGWRVIAATNAGPGTPPLPVQLAQYIGTVVESRRYGLVKEDPRFWTRLVEEEKVDSAVALVVGDNVVADQLAPESVGLQARALAVGGPGRTDLAAQLRAAGPRPSEAAAVVAGRREHWAGQDIVVAPHLTSFVTRVTRARLPVTAGGLTGTALVVRRRALPPAVLPIGSLQTRIPEVAWLLQPRDRRPYQTPTELRAVLEREGLTLDSLSTSDRRHALSMIREARSSETASARMADLVLFLRELRKGGTTE